MRAANFIFRRRNYMANVLYANGLKHFQLAHYVIEAEMLKQMTSNEAKLYIALMFLLHHKQKPVIPLTNSEIHDLTGLQPGRIANARDGLEELGLVEAMRSKGN